MKIQFCGASDGVTGSCHLIRTEKHQILLDCGQFQGGKVEEQKNFEEFPFDPTEIDCMILSHAHIDHCGRIPLLVKRGFKGDIYCTDATADLLEVMLKDSGYIHEKEAEWKNKKNQRAGRPLVEPLYTFNDAMDSLKYVKPVLYDQLIEINEDMKIVFNDAGHILGSAITEIWVSEGEEVSKIVFTGDLGVMERPILRNPVKIKKADYVIMETTYGNRLHPSNSLNVKELMDIIRKTAKRGGTTVIPSFAVGRTQELIYELNRVYDSDSEYRKDFEDLMVYIDSPMATTATEVFKRNAQVFDEETKEFITRGDNPLDFKNLQFTRSSQESMMLNANNKPKVIISASGMCEAGRIRHHLKHNLWDARNSIIFVGYQAEGTLGRMLVEGAKEITLFNEKVECKAEIHNLEGFSGHADRDGLIDWLKGLEKQPKQIFLVHGEMDAKEEFAKTVKEEVGFDTVVVKGNSEYELIRDEMITTKAAAEKEIDEGTINNTTSNIFSVHRRIEDILYNARQALNDENISPDKLAKINNIVMELEKNTMNLGAAIAEHDDKESLDKTLE
ncbi:MAG: MBL fold metallo-hydrolase [Firmicutes bacterium]|nr:MBL fold metallo-hydrolase [Bacillota bacterium]MDD7016204.1 MBL fold metallo-hydrolase [Bacillota bacterium]MDY4959828.1 MBL fold metallo-hydrolase [Lentihominibacter sp.]